MKKTKKNFITGSATIFTLFGALGAPLGVLADTTPVTQIESANIAMTTTAINSRENVAFDNLKAFANQFIGVQNGKLTITNSAAIENYIAKNLANLNATETKFTTTEYYDYVIQAGVNSINAELNTPGSQLQSDGGVVNNAYPTKETNGPISKTLSSLTPPHNHYWWGVRYYSTNKSSTLTLAKYFANQSTYFLNISLATGDVSLAAGALSMGITAALGGGVVAVQGLISWEMGDISSQAYKLAAIGKANKGIYADVNMTPGVHSVYSR
ncbi:MAG: hypothetical protein LBI43_06440 [Streptococcaceae bacterium]|jgi:hypothetical protein|nr:hypothetical protein [Streptococcaceae bacterium]